jgi:uncharacterized protein with HEPN domain
MKQSERGDDAFLRDIVHAAGDIKNSLRGVTRAAFDKNIEKKGFITYRISNIGEATSKLSAEFLSTHSSQPWRDIIGMRQIRVHHYWEVDYDIVWKTAHKDVPELARYVAVVLGMKKP